MWLLKVAHRRKAEWNNPGNRGLQRARRVNLRSVWQGRWGDEVTLELERVTRIQMRVTLGRYWVLPFLHFSYSTFLFIGHAYKCLIESIRLWIKCLSWARNDAKCWRHKTDKVQSLPPMSSPIWRNSKPGEKNSLQKNMISINPRVISYLCYMMKWWRWWWKPQLTHSIYCVPWHCYKWLSYINSFNLHNNPLKKVYYYYAI